MNDQERIKVVREIADFIAECASDLAADIQEGAMPEELGRMSNYGHWHATLMDILKTLRERVQA